MDKTEKSRDELLKEIDDLKLTFDINIAERKLAVASMIESESKFNLLNDAISDMLALNDIPSIFDYISTTLLKQLPETIILCISVDENNNDTKLENVCGLENSLIQKVISISGFDPVGKNYKLVKSHHQYFSSGNFVEFPCGLIEFTGGEYPALATKAIEKLIGLNKIYTIGINKDNTLLAAVHFFTFNNREIKDSNFIESLVKQAGIVIQKKLAEQALKESEERFRNIFNNAPMGIYRTTRKGEILLANPRLIEILGFSSLEDLQKRNIKEEGYENQDSRGKFIEDVESKGEINNFEVVWKRKDGTDIYVNEYSRAVSDKSGNILYYEGTVEDVTERKISEEILKDGEKNLAEAQNIAKIGSWEWDMISNKVTWSQEMFIVFDIEPDTYDGKPESLLKVVHPDDLEHFAHSMNDNLVDGRSPSLEYRIIHRDGSVHNILAMGRIEFDNSGKPIRNVGTAQDITEQKKADEALRESEERYSTIVKASPNIILIHKDGILLYVNEVAENVLEYSKEEAIGKQMFDFVADESKQIAYINMQKRAAGEDVPAYEANVVTRSGLKKTMLVQATTIPYNNEAAFLAVLTDITVLKQYENDLEIAKKKAEENDELKTAFLQNMSHEIRTPLNGIIGFSGLLMSDDITKEEIKEYTCIIQNSGHRLIELINNVLDISKIETGQVEIKNKAFSINSLMTNLKNFFGPIAGTKELRLNFHNFLDDSNCIVYMDDAKLNQICTNLINNSIKFTNAGSIDFGYEIVENLIQFYVKDTGSGISVPNQERIFERFTQANNSITRGYEGAGLGLAICRGLVELMGGRLWVESEESKGSTFFFTLPYCPSSLTESAPQKTASIEQNHKKVKILIAEDDTTSFEYLKKIFKSDKYILLRAENGEQAVDIVKATHDIDLILMDIKMPVLNGIEATKQIKQIKPDLPIIAQTAYAFNEEMEEILSIGCDDYIIKPIEKDKLLVLIEKYV